MRNLFGATLLLLLILLPINALGQEIDAQVRVNHQQIQGTSTSVFENLETSLRDFINERQWTNLQVARGERISCTFNITVTKYDESAHTFECRLAVAATRPVFDASYTTTTFSTQDPNFNFEYQEFDKLDFRPDVIDNELTALVAYYVYLIIGIDLDTFSLKGGTDQLQVARDICNNAQSLLLSAKGWKAFEDDKNRYAIINDYMDNGLEDFRQMQYKYYREGLDIMAESAERGRAAITEALSLLGKAHEKKSMSMLPQLFTEYKRDEIVNIYQGQGHGTQKEKTELVDMLTRINASQSAQWRRITANQ
ncbi:MAG: DUF4835 family protein [Bacteroidales bacterium]|nr:DUF4835 family protein [Candidatus Equimonas enterica]